MGPDQIRTEALISAIEALAARQTRAADTTAREVEAMPHLDVEATAAEREARAEARGFALGLRTAARWATEAAENARRGAL